MTCIFVCMDVYMFTYIRITYLHVHIDSYSYIHINTTCGPNSLSSKKLSNTITDTITISKTAVIINARVFTTLDGTNPA